MPRYIPSPRGKHQLRFAYSQWDEEYEATTKLASSPFGRSILKIQVRGTAWDLITEDELALIDRVLDSLPELLPLISAKLREWLDPSDDSKAFRKFFKQASICLDDRGEHPRRSWSFIVERLGFEGDNQGWVFKFTDNELQDVFAGD